MIKCNFVLHWKLFDIIEHHNGWEWSILFMRCYSDDKRITYSIDQCGLGIDWLKTSKYRSLMLNLIFCSVTLQFKRKQRLKLVC